MSKKEIRLKIACFFDDSIECPVKLATEGKKVWQTPYVDIFLEKACKICPIRLKMIEK